MSWPNTWQVQPGFNPGYSTTMPPQAVQPVAAAAAPAAYPTMTPDQYAQWQQWQQYQQQYAQWHAQYGEQYARQMGKPLPAVAAPMPMTPAMTIPTSVPPAAVMPTHTMLPPTMAVAPPIPIGVAPPPPSEPHPDTIAAEQAPAPPPPVSEELTQKTAEELAFDEQFRKWEEEFDNWKRKNANHPDKATYREYEKKFEDCRKKLVERREYLKKKRLAEAAAVAAAAAAANAQKSAAPVSVPVVQSRFSQPPPPPPPPEESSDIGLFKNALGGNAATGGGIPGLDLIGNEEKRLNDDVVEVIDLDEEKEDKPNVNQLNAALNKNANPVNALASLLKDPKVSALLNVISAGNNTEAASIGNSELLQQIQNAAGAVINANQNGSPGMGNQNQSTWPMPKLMPPEDRSRSSFHDDGRSVLSGDDRSRDFDDFSRGPPPLLDDLNRSGPPGAEFNRGLPPGAEIHRGPPPGGEFNRGPPKGMDFSRGPPPGFEFNRGPPMGNEFCRGPPPGFDFNRGPPPGSEFNRGPPPGNDFNRGPQPGNEFNRGPPPGNEFNRGPPPGHEFNRGPPHGNDFNRGPPPVGDFNRGPPPANDYTRCPPPNRKGDAVNFNKQPPPALMNLDLTRPPPIFGGPQPNVARPQRSDQTSPALSNTSSTGSRQRQSRWSMQSQQSMKHEMPEEMDRFDQPRQPPSVKHEPFNGSDFPPTNIASLYEGHCDELQIDPEIGEPCAVPKPNWMEEEEYQEIFDRYEDVEIFEERKHKMEVAIRQLEQKKRAERLPPFDKGGFGGSKNVSFEDKKMVMPDFGNGNNSDSGDRGPSRWMGGMPKPFIKEEPPHNPAKRQKTFAEEDDYFKPKQIIDYSNGAPRVIDYGHSSSGPLAHKDAPPRQDNDWNSRGRQSFGQRGERGPFKDEGFNPQRFDYNHTQPIGAGCITDNFDLPPPSFMVDNPPHYTPNSTNRLAAMHNNPNPAESNPCYPSKFILMNDNRPNRPRTKRGKRASSIRKQQLKQEETPAGASANVEAPIPGQPLSKTDKPSLSVLTDYELEMKRGSDDYPKHLPVNPIIMIDELLLPPGRFRRHPRICFILRGIPGSGKSYLARMIKECEVKNGGQAPRVLSIDDYFLVEKEVREPDAITGRPTLLTKSDYKYDGDMEEVYMQNLVKAFKRTITEKLYNFIIVDCVNERLQYYNEFHNFGRSNGFKVYTCTMQTDIELCIEQNIHNRKADEIRCYANDWALGPADHVLINASMLLDPQDDHPVTHADMDICTEEDDQPQMPDPVDATEEPEVNAEQQDIDEDSNADAPEPVWMASVNHHAGPRR
ncbi:uncharacterized protein LOC129729984 isoform X2 [Wyeomyia smithii]|uniref:uncharacterized protein LOC129729984 isoform X2 n=1 Tax=Wyeomyia smithii TaxID=174621 RepID=UPI0024680407|nr:uncharacterized protein LOC129729984 isoform X2 [Wyeomyia smithii]